MIRTPYPNIGLGIQRLHGHYARHAYVANNPVKAGLGARPEDWRRSSFAAGGDRFIDTVTFGADRDLERQLGQAAGAPASSVARRAAA
jgi:hypothetical protein